MPLLSSTKAFLLFPRIMSSHLTPKTRLRGVVFDMDGTLTVPVIDFLSMYKAVLGDDEYLRVKASNPVGIDILKLIDHWSPPQQRQAYDTIAHFEKQALDHLQIMPGAADLCNVLDSKKIRRGLITRNMKSAVDLFHQRFGITFSPALSREFRPYKPDPAPLLHICSLWEVQPNEVIMVGDSLKDDIACGGRAGAHTCLLDQTGRYDSPEYANVDFKPDFKLTSLAEVYSILDEQVLDLLKVGEVNRHFGETNMNVRSSRSHTIFRMVIESKGKDSDSSDNSSISDIVRVSVLNLVDLAGSERIAKTGADGVRLKEGKYINKSLMILGNVINKLSEGSKNRGHIPYRDSKLTRILQPALGGNAKTSIICTVAPEEDHIEETKGTLQFASRAKSITNCVQVNEILTDAALLKRQQLEIEELRKKLQGSHAGVLEQEVLKLRNDLLKYEMERGKLEMELEEERKSRNQWISEQQMKIENSSTTSFSVSDCGTNDNQGPRYLRRGLIEEYSDINSTSQGDIFKSPCLKTASAFVVKRSRNSTLPDSSPSLPEAFSNVADEDMWLKMNNGYVADLDSLQITPTRNIQSFPLSDTTPGCISQTAKYEREVQDLRRQLELANEKINELERKNSEEVPSSKQLIGENPNNQQETPLIQELPMRLSEYVENYKDSFEEVLSVMQRFALDGKVSTDKMLSTMSEIGANLFATLESHFSTGNYAAIREQQKEFHERMNNLITSLELSESSITGNQKRTALCSCEHKGSGLGGETESAYSKDALNERCESLERELQLLQIERDSLLEKFSELSDKLAIVSSQKETALKDLNIEVQRRKNLEGEVKQFTAAFVCRQKSLTSLRGDLKTKIEKWRTQTPISVPKSFDGQD